MQSESKVHYQDKAPKKTKVEVYVCDNCGEPITKKEFEKEGLCADCRQEFSIK